MKIKMKIRISPFENGNLLINIWARTYNRTKLYKFDTTKRVDSKKKITNRSEKRKRARYLKKWNKELPQRRRDAKLFMELFPKVQRILREDNDYCSLD